MKNKLLKLSAYLLLILGMISMMSPIPGGIFLLAGALTLLICSDPIAQHCLKWVRTRVNWFNKTIHWLEDKVGVKIKVMGDALKLTRPSEDENDKNLSHKEYIEKQKDLQSNKIDELYK